MYIYNEDMSLDEQKNGAYWERNMLALMLAESFNRMCVMQGMPLTCGWYLHGEWEGWSRVISIGNGTVTFHVPDDFDLGGLPQIEPNWDGHGTEEKWKHVMAYCGVKEVTE